MTWPVKPTSPERANGDTTTPVSTGVNVGMSSVSHSSSSSSSSSSPIMASCTSASPQSCVTAPAALADSVQSSTTACIAPSCGNEKDSARR